MAFDLDSLQYATQEQFVNVAHKHITQPTLIIALIGVIIAYWISCAVVNENKKDWSSSINIFIFFGIAILIIFGLLYFIPQLTQNVINGFMEFFIGA